ncbi:hypothetical protein QBC35DRAFT_476711 [Podospora australis]|uniref:Uncharacterized protein n=1 Tax=Podospora australis TaxID=1536484 RepID=A0AAN7AFT4_9PEZI|nr:hypothetical protein QBC35DRAFT_476711 [Podospora australis]
MVAVQWPATAGQHDASVLVERCRVSSTSSCKFIYLFELNQELNIEADINILSNVVQSRGCTIVIAYLLSFRVQEQANYKPQHFTARAPQLKEHNSFPTEQHPERHLVSAVSRVYARAVAAAPTFTSRRRQSGREPGSFVRKVEQEAGWETGSPKARSNLLAFRDGWAPFTRCANNGERSQMILDNPRSPWSLEEPADVATSPQNANEREKNDPSEPRIRGKKCIIFWVRLQQHAQ